MKNLHYFSLLAIFSVGYIQAFLGHRHLQIAGLRYHTNLQTLRAREVTQASEESKSEQEEAETSQTAPEGAPENSWTPYILGGVTGFSASALALNHFIVKNSLKPLITPRAINSAATQALTVSAEILRKSPSVINNLPLIAGVSLATYGIYKGAKSIWQNKGAIWNGIKRGSKYLATKTVNTISAMPTFLQTAACGVIAGLITSGVLATYSCYKEKPTESFLPIDTTSAEMAQDIATPGTNIEPITEHIRMETNSATQETKIDPIMEHIPMETNIAIPQTNIDPITEHIPMETNIVIPETKIDPITIPVAQQAIIAPQPSYALINYFLYPVTTEDLIEFSKWGANKYPQELVKKDFQPGT